jgi:hypothetical protein
MHAIDQLRKAIKVVEKKHDRTLMEEFVHKAYEDNAVMVALMRKLIPDKKVQDVNIGGQEDNPISLIMFGKNGNDTK